MEANYTMQLRDIVEDNDIFDFDFTVVDDATTNKFKDLFISYYYYYEIDSETVEIFKQRLKSAINMDIDYYNELLTANKSNIDIFNSRTVEDFETTDPTTSVSDTKFKESPDNTDITQEIPTTLNYSKTEMSSIKRTRSVKEQQNNIEMLSAYINQRRDILSEWILKFKNLFITVKGGY